MILIAGGTGFLGRQIVCLLNGRGLTMRVLTREQARARDLESDRVEIAIGDVRNPATIASALVGVRTVVSAMSGYGPSSGANPRTVDGEGNRHLIRAAEAAGVEHFVLVSVHAASPDHPMELMRMKFLAEQELTRSRVAGTIIRPTAFMETWARVVGEPLIKKGKALILGRGENPINFVAASDVARVVELAVVDPTMRGLTVDVGGPENLTLMQFAATFAAASGLTNRCSHVPRSALRVLSILARPVSPALARLAHDAVVIDTSDFKFEPSQDANPQAPIPRTPLAEVLSGRGRLPGVVQRTT